MPVDRSDEIPADVYLPSVFAGPEWRAGSRGNWFWLLDLPAERLAVELSRGAPTHDDLLRRRFETVRHVDLDSPVVPPLPIASAIVDCVLLHRPWLRNDAPNVNALLSECGRILRPGGCLVLALDHSLSFGRSSIRRWLPRAVLAAPAAVLRRWNARLAPEPRLPWPLHGLTHALRIAGFAEVRPYYVLPTIDAPQQLIPAHRHAMAVHDALQAHIGVRSVLRRALLEAGVEAAFFPGFFLIAVR